MTPSTRGQLPHASSEERRERLVAENRFVGRHSTSTSTRSPVLAIVGSLAAGALLAVALLLGPASGGSEPMVTGSVLFAFGLGWGLMAVLTTRFSAQPQTWMVVPAAVPRHRSGSA